MVKSCVFFAVRTELLNIILMSFGFKGLKSHAWYRLLTGTMEYFNNYVRFLCPLNVIGTLPK
jgi:hypothetical protein